MIQQVKALSATPDNLSSLLVAPMSEGEGTLTGCPLTSIYMLCHVYLVPSHMHPHKINK